MINATIRLHNDCCVNDYSHEAHLKGKSTKSVGSLSFDIAGYGPDPGAAMEGLRTMADILAKNLAHFAQTGVWREET